MCLTETNGGYGEWTNWSNCTSTCNGRRNRTRECNNPPSKGLNRMCPGNSYASEMCNWMVSECTGSLILFNLSYSFHRSSIINIYLCYICLYLTLWSTITLNIPQLYRGCIWLDQLFLSPTQLLQIRVSINII